MRPVQFAFFAQLGQDLGGLLGVSPDIVTMAVERNGKIKGENLFGTPVFAWPLRRLVGCSCNIGFVCRDAPRASEDTEGRHLPMAVAITSDSM